MSLILNQMVYQIVKCVCVCVCVYEYVDLQSLCQNMCERIHNRMKCRVQSHFKTSGDHIVCKKEFYIEKIISFLSSTIFFPQIN